jgi:hypothetical protein
LREKVASSDKRGACAAFCIAANITPQPLLTGNSVSIGFSVLVPLATNKHPQEAALSRASIINREETCAN